ncbi:DUF4362 domain-containing protein [Planococcus chinensis]|uniref:DUF4362 domain-containing protein n=1 Tax=Planococcus chinensis TaxID=272917 RepID=UPI001CC50423|nr:DUF4362 domain-containing protein [Planococcus chinensis]
MKKAGLILMACLLLFGCQNEHDSFPEEDTVKIKNSGDRENFDRLDRFLQNFQQREPDHIKVIFYTTEGDPIYQDLEFDGKAIKSIYDSREDQYGSGEVIETICTEFEAVETGGNPDYILTGCENKDYETEFIRVQ